MSNSSGHSGDDTDSEAGAGERGTGRTSGTDGEPDLSPTEVFELLSAARRQETLRFLSEQQETAELADLAEHVASVEYECDPAELSRQQRNRVYVGLYQSHLPKLADANVVHYDDECGTVTLRDPADKLLEHISLEETGPL